MFKQSYKENQAGEGERTEQEYSNHTEKMYQQNIGNPVCLKYTICSLSDETSKWNSELFAFVNKELCFSGAHEVFFACKSILQMLFMKLVKRSNMQSLK